MTIAQDSKAKLHCCGLHHHDHDRPQGVTLILAVPLPSSDIVRVSCYGTGDNQDSCVLMFPSPHLSWRDETTWILADDIARGSNVTLLVPHLASETSLKRPRDEEEQALSFDTQELRRALVQYLRTTMDVSFLGSLEVSPSAAPIDVQCRVVLSRRAGQESVPTLYLHETTQHDEEVLVVVEDDPVLVKVCRYMRDPVTILRAHRGHRDQGADKEAYLLVMKEMLYFFKKHLHDWS